MDMCAKDIAPGLWWSPSVGYVLLRSIWDDTSRRYAVVSGKSQIPHKLTAKPSANLVSFSRSPSLMSSYWTSFMYIAYQVRFGSGIQLF